MINEPSKILAIKVRSLGDTILVSAPLMALRTAFPMADIQVIVAEPWASILVGHPGVNKIWAYRRKDSKVSRFISVSRLFCALRNEKFDCILSFHASPSTALLSRALGAPIRGIHFHGHNDKNRYSTLPIPGKGILKPIIERDMDVLRALGAPAQEGQLPKVFLSEEERAAALDFLEKQNLCTPVLALGLGTSRVAKSWPLQKFAALAEQWIARTGGSVLAIGSPQEKSLLNEFLEIVPVLHRHAVKAVSNLELRKVGAVLSHCSAFMGNDSGLKHLAVAVGTRTCTVFGPEDPFEWHPYPRDLHPYFFMEGLTCRDSAEAGMRPWCGRSKCIEHRCMKEIGVEQVLEECIRISSK